jgi:hypothetical protein
MLRTYYGENTKQVNVGICNSNIVDVDLHGQVGKEVK